MKITKVPGPYLSKVLQLLTKEGLVEAHRGIHGGFCLSRPAKQITILEAVNAVDPIQRINVCPLGLKAHGKHLCPLHKKMDATLEQMERAFASTTLADVLSELSQSVPLCVFPQSARQRCSEPQRNCTGSKMLIDSSSNLTFDQRQLSALAAHRDDFARIDRAAIACKAILLLPLRRGEIPPRHRRRIGRATPIYAISRPKYAILLLTGAESR